VVERIVEAVSTPFRWPRQYMPPFTCTHKRHSGSRPESSLLVDAANQTIPRMSANVIEGSYAKRRHHQGCACRDPISGDPGRP
jgi:hypothetical protein